MRTACTPHACTRTWQECSNPNPNPNRSALILTLTLTGVLDRADPRPACLALLAASRGPRHRAERA
eukprot:scaffold94964_cov59-Phaeocystis_antarctica.AAC.1